MAKDPKNIEEVVLDHRTDPDVQKRAIDAERSSSKRGQLIGLFVLVLGVLLTVLGVSGVVDFQLKGFGLNAILSNAAPGVLLIVLGAIIILVTRLSIKSARSK
jgi:hypothetical protein